MSERNSVRKIFGVYLRADIDPPIMDKYNIKAENATAAAKTAKEMMFSILSRRGKCILENDIKILMVKDDYGRKVDFENE